MVFIGFANCLAIIWIGLAVLIEFPRIAIVVVFEAITVSLGFFGKDLLLFLTASPLS